MHVLTKIPRYYALEYSETVEELSIGYVRMAGANWARRAYTLLMESMNEITIERLMVSCFPLVSVLKLSQT